MNPSQHSALLNKKKLLPPASKTCFAVFNANGICTEVNSSGQRKRRVDFITKFLVQKEVSVMGILEHHLSAPEELTHLQEHFKAFNFHFHAQLSPQGRGGASIAFRQDWSVPSPPESIPIPTHPELQPRMMLVKLLSPFGACYPFLVAHFHHEANLRQVQWTTLHQFFEHRQDRIILLADHNSFILSHRDVARPPQSIDSEVAAARTVETQFLATNELIDAYPFVHEAKSASSHLEGWTWGFPAATSNKPPVKKKRKRNHKTQDMPQPKPPPKQQRTKTARPANQKHGTSVKDRRRRIDRIHFPTELSEYVTGCYPLFLGASDHKCVLMKMDPPPQANTAKRTRCPTNFLKNQDLIDTLKAEVMGLHTDGFCWWRDAQNIIMRAAIDYGKHHNPSGLTNIQALVMECSTTHISPLAWDYLNDLGCHPPDPSSAYSMLVTLQAQSEG